MTVSAVSFGAGIAAGYFLTRRQYKQIETEIQVVEQLTFDFSTQMEETAEQIMERARLERRSTYVIHEENLQPNLTVPEPINVFVEVDPDWNYEAERATREHKSVYIIHRDEFFGDEMGWDSQATLTWYEQDEVLTGEQDEVLMDQRSFIGEDNLKWGHGSGDPNVVYIRNEYFNVEYEVLRDPGSYEVNVLGGQVEERMNRDDIRHSRAPGKFRGD